MTTEPGSIEPSGWGPMGETQVLAAMLGTDRADVASYTRVLTGALAAALPPGMIEVTRRRGLGARIAGRASEPVELVVHGAGHDLALRADRHGGVAAELRQVVGRVVISRRELGLDQWLRALAETLVASAACTAASRRALEQFLGDGV